MLDNAARDALTDVARRAKFLRERLRDGPALSRGEVSAWREPFDVSDPSWFAKRLEWDGVSPELLGATPVGMDSALPEEAWLGTLRELVGRAQARARTGTTTPPDSEPVPFADVLVPAVELATERLSAGLQAVGLDPGGIVERSALRDLERSLLDSLSRLSSQALYAEFGARRSPGLALLGALGFPVTGRVAYTSFVDDLLERGLIPVFDRYPVLARLVACTIETWVATTLELLVRLADDRATLDLVRHGAGPAPAAVTIDATLGDRHRGGRVTTLVAFSDGTRVLYKPRSLAPEAAFNRLIEWCNIRGLAPELPLVTVVDRGDYGWMEHVDHAPCEDLAAARLFYSRAGALLCLLHLTATTDCHFENVVASGSAPLLVDLETILHPEPVALSPADPSGPRPAQELVATSVLRVGLLPRWETSSDPSLPPFDRSGLGSGGWVTVDGQLRWENVNTDAMTLSGGARSVRQTHNVPVLGERYLEPEAYADEILDGFERTYRFLLEHRDEVSVELTRLLGGRSTRFVQRPTRIYTALLNEAWSPGALGDGVAFGACLEQLAKAYLVADARPLAWPLLLEEIVALEALDVPYFSARTDSADLRLEDGKVVPALFVDPGLTTARNRLAAMSEDDLRVQGRLISASLTARGLRVAPLRVRQDAQPAAMAPIEPTDDALIEVAERIGFDTAQAALHHGSEAAWLGADLLHEHSRFRVGLLDDSLYAGNLGVAVFLAALSRATNDRAYADLAERALHRFRVAVRGMSVSEGRAAIRAFGLGAGHGVGAWLLGLVHAAQALGEPGLSIVDDALRISRWLTAATIRSDDRLDLVDGTAGSIVGLLSLHAIAGDEGALVAASACGEHLLERRVARAEHRVWLTVGSDPLVGFGHGQSGVARALVGLYQATSDERLREAAVDAIAYERAMYSSVEENWPDLRPPESADPSGYPVRWCHGAPGILLARLRCRSALAPDPEGEAEISRALRIVKEHFPVNLDHLCCGNAGLVEALLDGGGNDADDELRTLARSHLLTVAARRGAPPRFEVASIPGLYQPSLFQGTAGIGYTALRAVDPGLASIAAFDAPVGARSVDRRTDPLP
ncbi:MAG: type 2 lanthipeptide synthetase LanM family protein [Gaiellales bacterium]